MIYNDKQKKTKEKGYQIAFVCIEGNFLKEHSVKNQN